MGGDACDPEVGHEGPARVLFEQDVVRLHVPVHDASRVRVRESPSDLLHDAHRVVTGQWPCAAHALAERFTVHVAHDEEHETIGFLDRVDRDDIRVGQAGCCPGLAEKALPEPRVLSEIGREELDRHEAIEGHIPSKEDDAHTASPELAV